MAQPGDRLESASPAPEIEMRQALTKLIEKNGSVKEEMQSLERPPDDDEEFGGSKNYAASLVIDEADGFQLWLGGLDDALDLVALRKLGINSFVNCAHEECQSECMAFGKAPTGRRRCLAHAASIQDVGANLLIGGDGGVTMSPDEVRAAAKFNHIWYSAMLGYDVSYLALPANDVEDYPMDMHFAEIVSFLKRCMTEKRKVLVHCMRGINRSASATVAFLCGGLDYRLQSAVDIASKSRGYILSNESFLDQLVAIYGKEKEPPPAKTGFWSMMCCASRT